MIFNPSPPPDIAHQTVFAEGSGLSRPRRSHPAPHQKRARQQREQKWAAHSLSGIRPEVRARAHLHLSSLAYLKTMSGNGGCGARRIQSNAKNGQGVALLHRTSHRAAPGGTGPANSLASASTELGEMAGSKPANTSSHARPAGRNDETKICPNQQRPRGERGTLRGRRTEAGLDINVGGVLGTGDGAVPKRTAPSTTLVPVSSVCHEPLMLLTLGCTRASTNSRSTAPPGRMWPRAQAGWRGRRGEDPTGSPCRRLHEGNHVPPSAAFPDRTQRPMWA